MLEFALHDHDTMALGVSWPHWTQRNLPIDRLVLVGGEAVNGVRTPVRVLGVWTESSASVLSMKTFNDAREGVVQGSAYGIFEVEKLLRMALRQSVIAFEFLASHALLQEPRQFDSRFILRESVSQDLVDNLVRESQWRDWQTLRSEDLHAAASMLSCAAVLSRGVVTLHTPTALHLLGLSVPTSDAEWRALEPELQGAVTRDTLPPQPTGEDALSQWLSNRRLEVEA